MIFYLLLYIFSLCISVLSFDKHTVSVNNQILAKFFAVFLILVCGLRFGIGTDYWSYYDIYNGSSELERIEIGFKSIILFSHSVSKNFSLFLLFISLLSISLKVKYFSTLYNPFLAIFIYICVYYFPLDFNVIRQGLASSFIYFAVEAGKKKKLINYLFFVGIASLFHISAVVFIPVYFFIYRLKIKFKTVVIIFILSIVLRVIVLPILFNLVRNFVLSRFNSSIISQLINYFWLGDFSLSLNFFRRLFFIVAYLLIFGISKSDCYLTLYLISFFVSTILTGNDIFAYRLSSWFDIFSIPLFCSKRIILSHKNIVVFTCFIIVLTVLFFSSMQDALPYRVSSF